VSRTTSIRSGALAATGVVAALLLVQTASMASAPTAASVAPAASTDYRAEASCGLAKPGHATCFAMRLVRAARGMTGARALANTRPAYATGPAGGFTPGDLAKAYGVDPTAATSLTVAIVDAYSDPHARADLNHFDQHYGLPNETGASLKIVNQSGNASPLPTGNADWAGEISLDLDAVRGLCNNCKILLVEANSNSYANLAAAVNRAVSMGADIVSNSYGGPEGAGLPANAYNHPGTVITASTGDDGLFDWDNFNLHHASASRPNFPSSLSTVVAVGGTTLYLNQDGTRSGESVWNENGSSDVTGFNLEAAMGATGGGCSTRFTAKPWQTGVAKWSETTCGTKRLAADVSALADPYTGYDIYDSYKAPGWQTYGGTSLATPLIAAMWALAGGAQSIGYPAQTLYQNFNALDHATKLYDVTNGGNGACDGTPARECGGPGGLNTLGKGILDCAWQGKTSHLATGRRECDAAVGFDGPSGVGTPIGLGAFQP
jgi:subtilase family serine protease